MPHQFRCQHRCIRFGLFEARATHRCYGRPRTGCSKLLESGADVNAFTSDRQTPLFFALLNESFGIIQTLLGYEDIQIDAEGGNWGTALQECVVHGRVDVVKDLLYSGADANINGQDRWGNQAGTPTALAATHNYAEIIRLSRDYGANINATGGKQKGALIAAAKHGHMESLQLLLDMGGDLQQVYHESGPGSESVGVFDIVAAELNNDII